MKTSSIIFKYLPNFRLKIVLSSCFFTLLTLHSSALAIDSNNRISKEQLDYSLTAEQKNKIIQAKLIEEENKNKFPPAILDKMIERADAGTLSEQMKLARYYAKIEAGNDLLKSFHWYQKAAEQGDVTALGMLGLFYLNGMANIQDIDLAIYYFIKAADAGDLDSQLILASFYSSNYKEVKRDYSKAYHYFQLAAKQESAEALLMLGIFHHRGWIGEVSPSQAEYYWLAAAEVQSIDAMRLLGDYHRFAWAGKIDLKKAKIWYRKAVKNSDSIAAYRLAEILKESAVNDIFDAEERLYCLEIAALEATPQILLELSEAYILGLGCEADLRMGINYLADASNMGNHYASFLLSLYHCLENDKENAYKGKNIEEIIDGKFPILRAFFPANKGE